MERSSVDISYVHRHLCDAVFIYEPADCLAAFQSARNHHVLSVLVLHDLSCDRVALSLRTTFLAYIECDCVGTAGRSRVEVVVHGDEEVACADIGGTGLSCTLSVVSGTEVRHAVWVAHLLGKSLVFTGTADSEILALRLLCGSLVAVAWDFEFVVDALGELSCKFCTFLQSHARDRDERKHVSGSRTRVSTMMLAHVDELTGLLYSLERSLHDSLRTSDKRHYGTVGGLARIYIQDLYATGFLDRRNDGVDNFPVAALTEIRHTFDDSFHIGYDSFM